MGFQITGNGQGSNTLSVPGGWSILEDQGIGGIQESIPGESGPQAVVKFKVNNSDDRYSFCNQLLGLWTGTPPSSIVYSAPFAYPPSPQLMCTSIQSIEGLGTKKPILGVGLPWWFGKHAIVTAIFSRPPWQASTNQGYFSISFSGGGEGLMIPETTYQFGDGTPTTTPVAIKIPHAQITVTRYRMPFLPDTIAVPMLGAVNNAPFYIGWNIYAAGTLLFNGFSSEVAFDPFGNITFTVQYLFSFRWIPWNNVLHPNRTTGFAPVTDGNGNPIYRALSFEVLP